MHESLSPRRAVPSVSRVLDALGAVDVAHGIVVDTIRQELAALRKSGDAVELASIVQKVREALALHKRAKLQRVINGSGVILHTNFGRAPLSRAAAQAVAEIAASYTNLEFDLEKGERGGRGRYIERNLATLCGAESATVVNNCAAALVLAVKHFAFAREVIISRGELVQIGGGFRIGEILVAAGARLREVGATNRTTLADYADAINRETGLILSVHRSNFYMEGFVESQNLSELAVLARKKRIPLLADLGTGSLAPPSQFADEEVEPAPSDALRKGVNLVCFSGDKLFGGPQCGVIAGQKNLVEKLKRDPLFRALRCDKLCLAALQATVDLHLRGAAEEVPALQLMRVEKDELRARAAVIFSQLRGLPARISVGRGRGKAGGGTKPRAIIPSITIDVIPEGMSLQKFSTIMRNYNPPIVGYISNGAFKLDLRTIFPAQDELVVDAIRSACAGSGSSD